MWNCNKWRTLVARNTNTKSAEQMKIILFDSVRCMAKICLVKKNITCCYKRKVDIKKQQNYEKASTHTYIVTAKENCCVSGMRKTRRNVEKH